MNQFIIKVGRIGTDKNRSGNQKLHPVLKKKKEKG